MRIELDESIIIIKQPLITNEVTAFTLIKFEDDGETIKALTDLGYVTIYDNNNYPEGGIFNLDKEDVIMITKTIIQNL